jgi:hypothetical protein
MDAGARSRRRRWLLALLAALLGGCERSIVLGRGGGAGGGFATVETYQLEPGRGAAPMGGAVDASGRIVLCGQATDGAGSSHWIVRAAEGVEGPFATVDDFQRTAGSDATATAVTVDGAGEVWVTGSADTPSRWILRRGTASGFSTADDFQLAAGEDSFPAAIGAAPGALFLGGSGTDGASVSHWLVRSGGTSWPVSDDFQLAPDRNCWGEALRWHASGLYVGASCRDSAGRLRWLVRRSLDGGATFETVDEFSLGDDDAYVREIGVDPSGGVYVVGRANSPAGWRWIVRRWAQGESGFRTVDDFQYASGQDAFASAIAFDGQGRVYVAGRGADGAAVTHWIVRVSADGGQSWAIGDDFQLAAGQDSAADVAIAGGSGELLVAGTGSDGSGEQWVVRVLR